MVEKHTTANVLEPVGLQDVWHCHQEEGLRNTQATTGNDTYKQTSKSIFLNDDFEGVHKPSGREALSGTTLCFDSHHLKGLIPGTESTTDDATHRLLPQG